MKKSEMAEEMERLRAQLNEYKVDEEPLPDPNGYYVPTAIHIAIPPEHGLGSADNFRHYCGFEREGSWEAEWMEDKKARTLPTCPDCIEAWEAINGKKWSERKTKKTTQPSVPVKKLEPIVSKVVVSDYRI